MYDNELYSDDAYLKRRRQIVQQQNETKKTGSGSEKKDSSTLQPDSVILKYSKQEESGMTHTVQEKDTLWDIAMAHGTTIDELLKLNPRYDKNPNLIHPGEIIQLPKGTEKKGMTTGDQLQLKGGKISVVDFSAANERSGTDESYESIDITLKFIPDEGGSFTDISNLGWFQTFRTNYETDSNEKPPKELDIKDYVDGGSYPKQTAVYCDVGKFDSVDSLHRKSLPDRDVFWQAETSVVDKSGLKPKRLFTVVWGFNLDKKGNPKVIALKAMDLPSAYHQAKLSELPTK